MAVEERKSQLRIGNRLIVDGAKLTEARVAKGMPMSALAAALGCNKSQVSRWETGELVPSEARIQKMTELLETWSFVIGNPTHGKDMRRKRRVA